MKNLKILFILLTITLSSPLVYSQSPGYGIKISVKSENGEDNYTYKYYHTLCTPVESSMNADEFYGDLSSIDWKNFSKGDVSLYNCSELPSDSKERYSYSNQIWAFESIVNLEIIREGNGEADTMKIVFPIIKSGFVTNIDLEDIEFREGLYNISDRLVYDYDNHLTIHLKDGYDWKKIEESPLFIR